MLTDALARDDSPLHCIDPRLRIIAAVAFSCTVAVFQDLAALVAACAVGVLLQLAAGVNMAHVARRLRVLLGFLLLLWLLLPLTYEGRLFATLGPLRFYAPGVLLAFQITLKSAAIVMVFTVLVATIPVNTLGQALGQLHVPAKLIYLLLMCYRYTFVIEQEYLRLRAAMKIRGFQPRTNLHTYRSYAYLVGMLFVRAAHRAERVHQAMCCRGFDGRFHSLAIFPSHPGNRWFAAASASAMIALLWLEWGI